MANLMALMMQSLQTQEGYIRSIDNQLASMPQGTLYQNKKSGIRYYFQNIYKNGIRDRTYLGLENGKQAQLISDLKRKRFLLGYKKVLECNVVALRACLLKYEEFDPAQISSRLAATYESSKDAERPQLNHQDHQDHQDQPDQQSRHGQQALDWQHAPYPRAEMHEESLKHEAIGGLMVRSKSEVLIAFALDLAHIPFHYEEILEFDNNKKIAPDFTILHPATGERVYWEHFGMMDDVAYATETFRKLVTYGQNGIMPGKSLIYTMETIEEPLSIREIQGMITHYLLN